MTGIIVTVPPTVEVPPGNNASNPSSLPPVIYTYALLNIPQTWSAKQTFPAGNISINASDVVGLAAYAVLNVAQTWTAKQTFPTGNVSINAADITGLAANLPLPSASTLGGIFSKTATTHEFLTAIGTDGHPVSAQPAFSDVSGQAALSQLPTLAVNTVLGSIAGGTPIALTTVQTTSLVNVFTAALKGSVPAPVTSTGKFLKDDATWALPAGATISHDNKFRNPDFSVWQRGTAAINLGTAQYTADGWIVTASGGITGTASRSANARPGMLTAYGLLLTGGSSVSGITAKQRIEGFVAAPLASQIITIQAQIRNDTAGSITPTITVKHANALDNWGATTTDVSAVNLQACANGAWTQVSYTFTADAAAGNGLEVTFDFGNNFSTSGKSVQVTECDIGIASSVQPPTFRSYPAELLYCQRYYYRLNSVGNSNSDPIFLAHCFSTTAAFGVVCDLPTAMRVIPTCSISGQGHLSGSTAVGGAGSAFTAVTLRGAPTKIVINSMTGGGTFGFAGQASMIYFNTTSGWIDASAEL